MTPNCVVRNEASRFGDGIATTEPKHCWRRLPAGTAEVKNRAVVARVVLVRFGSAAVYPRLPPRQVLSYPAPTGVGEPDGMRSGFRVDRVDPHGCGGASACPGPKREMPENRLRDALSLEGRGSSGNAVHLYEETVVMTACHDLLQEYPVADEVGFFTTEDKKYGTFKAWAGVLGLSEGTLRKYLTSVEGMTAKIHSGKIVERGFYAEADVRSACADLLRELPRADANGFIEVSTENASIRHGTVYAWAKALSLSRKALGRVLASHEGVTARDTSGRVVEGGFYPETIIRQLQQEWQGLPVADVTGFFTRTEDDQFMRYGTIHAWSHEFGLSYIGIQPRLKREQGMSGKDMHGRVLKDSFYSEEVARRACADLLEELPKAYAAGFLLLENEAMPSERCGTLNAWAKELHLGDRTVKERLVGQPFIKNLQSVRHVRTDFLSKRLMENQELL